MRTLSLALFCCFVAVGGIEVAWAGEILIDESVTIDGQYNETGLRIVAGANPPTVVRFVDPAYVEQSVYVEDASEFHLEGGEAHDSLYTYDESRAFITGGHIGDTVHIGDQSTLLVTGGTLSDYIYGAGQGRVDILGGSVWGVRAAGGSVVSIQGGNFTAQEQELGLLAGEASTILLYGTGFNYPKGPVQDDSGTLTGVLADGAPFFATFQLARAGEIRIVPEPATIILALGAALALGVRRLGRRMARRGD